MGSDTTFRGPRRFPRWAADAVTLSRIGLLPFFLVAARATQAAVAQGADSARARAFTLALLAAIALSDKLDGWLARRAQEPPTRRGAILDATADRLVQWVGVAYLTLWAAPGFTRLPTWLAAVFVARDVLLFGLWLQARSAGHVSLEHELHGKLATVAIFVTFLTATAAGPALLVDSAAALATGAIAFSTLRYARRTRHRAPPAASVVETRGEQ